MNNKKPTQKDLWKAQILEFFHNYFIGISNLECSNPNCPLLPIWDEIEEKNSKKGKCATLKIDQQTHLVVNMISNKVDGLGNSVEVTIEYKDGKQALVRNKAEIAELTKNLTEEEKNKLEFIDPSEVVYWFNNSTHTSNLRDAETIYLEDLWDIKEKIKWDREKSKKKVFLFCENEPNTDTQAQKIDASEKDYLFYIANPDITNEIKNYEVYSPSKGVEERTRLYQDYKEEFSELRRIFGIRHLTSKKEERQNNPEIELNEAQFIALERRKKRIREQSIQEFENKGFCQGEHILSYGTAYENREEKVLEVKEMEEVKEKSEQSEQKNKENKENLQENT